nr:BQ2448_6404 [Ipomoea trifida]
MTTSFLGIFFNAKAPVDDTILSSSMVIPRRPLTLEPVAIIIFFPLTTVSPPSIVSTLISEDTASSFWAIMAGGLEAQLSRLDGGDIACGATADDNDVVLLIRSRRESSVQGEGVVLGAVVVEILRREQGPSSHYH